MFEQNRKVNWKEAEDNLVTQWYHVSKIMSTIVPGSFGYFTFCGLYEEILKDPNFKQS